MLLAEAHIEVEDYGRKYDLNTTIEQYNVYNSKRELDNIRVIIDEIGNGHEPEPITSYEGTMFQPDYSYLANPFNIGDVLQRLDSSAVMVK